MDKNNNTGNYSVIKTGNLSEARKKIDNSIKENKKIIVFSQNEAFNRTILENKKIDILIISSFEKKARLKQRESRLNQILCKIAQKNDIAIGIDLSILKNKNKKEVSENISKLIETIKLCKKCKNNVILINTQKNRHDLFSFLLSLGMPTNMAKYAVENSIII